MSRKKAIDSGGLFYYRIKYQVIHLELNMKFSTKSTYGLRSIINLAHKSREGAVSLAKIAEEEGISLAYLEQIFAKLKKAGLIKAERGARGGYSLSKKPQEISVYDIVKSLEKEISYFPCVDEEGKVSCVKSENCGAVRVLSRLQGAVNKTLRDFKLSELL